MSSHLFSAILNSSLTPILNIYSSRTSILDSSVHNTSAYIKMSCFMNYVFSTGIHNEEIGKQGKHANSFLLKSNKCIKNLIC